MAYGVILGQTPRGSGSNSIKTCRFVVGTSTAGWTAADCDYLCDGTDDQVEINAAIQALPAVGGEIVILDGNYNLSDCITLSKSNVKLSGNGSSTKLKRLFTGKQSNGLVLIPSTSSRCCVSGLYFDGNSDNITGSYNSSICVSGNYNTVSFNDFISGTYGVFIFGDNATNNVVIGNHCYDCKAGICSEEDYNCITGNNCYSCGIGISLSGSAANTVSGNVCNECSSSGIRYFGWDCSITGNVCHDCTNGLNIQNGARGVITGNTFKRGKGGTSDYTSSQYTIIISSAGSDYNLIANNNILGKNYVANYGTGNTFVNNKYN